MSKEATPIPRPRPALASLRDATLSQTYVSLGTRRTTSPHEFYRYPARFSPGFAAAAIEAFSAPGHLVVDPFVGGGTTLVECMLSGRPAIGADLNPLATFVSRVKTQLLDDEDLVRLERWAAHLPSVLILRRPAWDVERWEDAGYLKDLDDAGTWRVRHLIALALDSLGRLPARPQDFARCVVLRTGQWALDMRREVPSAAEFREALTDHAAAMLLIAQNFRSDVRAPAAVINQASPGLADRPEMAGAKARLVLTSPPYPGVYVNYHRWKLRGRREIRAPYWIANELDGHGISRYTMGARVSVRRDNYDRYFGELCAAFRDVARYCDKKTTIVQVVGFNHPQMQFDRYLATMREAGFCEVDVPELDTADDGRLWRDVPNRRWWTKTSSVQSRTSGTSREVVLIHRLATG